MEYDAYYENEYVGTLTRNPYSDNLQLALGTGHAWLFAAIAREWEIFHDEPHLYDGIARDHAFEAFTTLCADIEVRDIAGRVIPGASLLLFPMLPDEEGGLLAASLSIASHPPDPEAGAVVGARIPPPTRSSSAGQNQLPADQATGPMTSRRTGPAPASMSVSRRSA